MGQSQGSARPTPRPAPRPVPPRAGESSSPSIDNESRWAFLEADGYTVIPGVVDQKDIDNALRVINRSLGKHTPIRDNMCPGVGGMKEITDLLQKSCLKGILETLVGPYSGGGGGQIALRFPGDNAGPDFEVYPGWESHWHIDGLSTPDSTQNRTPSGDIHNFTALVGVLLQDVLEEDMGNLVLYPGSHYELQDHFRAAGFAGVLARGTAALPQMKFSRPPVQIRGRAGDVVIANYMTAHLVAPNTSPHVRYCVYFRVKGQSFEHHHRRTLMHRPEAMLDVWLDWPRLAKAAQRRRLLDAEDGEDAGLRQAIAQSRIDY